VVSIVLFYVNIGNVQVWHFGGFKLRGARQLYLRNWLRLKLFDYLFCRLFCFGWPWHSIVISELKLQHFRLALGWLASISTEELEVHRHLLFAQFEL
jgi:hypothetical protein